MNNQLPIKFNRVKTNTSHWTFTIKPIAELLKHYVSDGKNWIDPMAGMYSPAEFTNDIDPKSNAKFHMDAVDFLDGLKDTYKGILFDPPYSYRQISEHYKALHLVITRLHTSTHFYSRIMNASYNKIMVGGYAISLGWNSWGFGQRRGFEVIEILLVAHGGHRNDTIVTVEQKMRDPD